MQRVLKAPRLTSADKAATFIDVCGDKFDVKVQNFIHVVAENDRLPRFCRRLPLCSTCSRPSKRSR